MYVNLSANELFVSRLSRYQIGVETSIRGSNFSFDSLELLYYKHQKTNFKCGGLDTNSPDSTKKKKETINP